LTVAYAGWFSGSLARSSVDLNVMRILVIPITGSGFIRSPDLPNALGPIVSL
jgi:hypothetical protein